jgi:hypothetical protein
MPPDQNRLLAFRLLRQHRGFFISTHGFKEARKTWVWASTMRLSSLLEANTHQGCK